MEIKTLECPFEIKQDSLKESGIFEGYASDYLNKKDSQGDIIVKGAFTETLKRGGRNGDGIAMLWQHDSKDPIGVYPEITEQGDKLKVIGQLAMGVQQANEAYILMKIKALNGLSIGWDVMRNEDGEPIDNSYEYNKEKNVRYLKQVELWEISPVTFPANTRAKITQVKAAVENSRTIREFEEALREAGLSKSAAEYLCSVCKPVLQKKWNANMLNILSQVKQLNKQIGG